jgi:hypothetical protein
MMDAPFVTHTLNASTETALFLFQIAMLLAAMNML